MNFITKKDINKIQSIFLNKNIFFNKKIYIYGSGEASKNLKKILINYKIKFQKYLNEEDFVNIKNLSNVIIINNSYKVRSNKNNFYTKNKKKIIDMDVHFLNNFKNYKNYITRNYVKFIKLFNNLQDNQSKKLLISFIKVKLSNDYANIKNYNFKDQYYLKKNGKKFNNIIDVGGYDGDTLKFFLKKKMKFKKYFIFEPDFKNYLKLKKNVKNINNSNIFIYNYAAGNQNGEIFFQSLGNSKSMIKLNKNLKTKKIKIVKLDKIIKEINFLKIDVENHEKQVILGAKKLISNFKPVVACAVYHDKNQLIDIFYTLKSLNKNYKFDLRLYSKSSNELILYAK